LVAGGMETLDLSRSAAHRRRARNVLTVQLLGKTNAGFVLAKPRSR